jgi:hypothetical protein
MGDMRKIGALWAKTSDKGTKFYSGKLDAEAVKSALAGGETRLLLFKSKNGGGKRPDLELFAAPERSDRERPEPRRESRVDNIDDNGFGDLP